MASGLQRVGALLARLQLKSLIGDAHERANQLH
jgi:hypothetical protein